MHAERSFFPLRRLISAAHPLLALILLAVALPQLAMAQTTSAALDALVAAYPNFLLRHDGAALYWRDGTRMPVGGDGANTNPSIDCCARPRSSTSFGCAIRAARWQDRRASTTTPDASATRPSSARCTAIAAKDRSRPHLVAIRWLPKTWGKKILVTGVNGIAGRLAAVSARDRCPARRHQARGLSDRRRIVMPRGGRTPASRACTATPRRSISISAFSDYWLWHKKAASDPLSQSHAAADRRDFRTARLHLGRQVVPLRYDALRVPARAVGHARQMMALRPPSRTGGGRRAAQPVSGNRGRAPRLEFAPPVAGRRATWERQPRSRIGSRRCRNRKWRARS